MRRAVLIVTIASALLAVQVGAQNPSPSPASSPVVIPAGTSRRLDEIEQRLTQIKNEEQTLQLLRENLILGAALDLSLTKKDLEAMEVGRDSGHWVFRKAPPKPSPTP